MSNEPFVAPILYRMLTDEGQSKLQRGLQAGEVVKLVAEMGKTLLVEREDGARFAVKERKMEIILPF